MRRADELPVTACAAKNARSDGGGWDGSLFHRRSHDSQTKRPLRSVPLLALRARGGVQSARRPDPRDPVFAVAHSLVPAGEGTAKIRWAHLCLRVTRLRARRLRPATATRQACRAKCNLAPEESQRVLHECKPAPRVANRFRRNANCFPGGYNVIRSFANRSFSVANRLAPIANRFRSGPNRARAMQTVSAAMQTVAARLQTVSRREQTCIAGMQTVSARQQTVAGAQITDKVRGTGVSIRSQDVPHSNAPCPHRTHTLQARTAPEGH